MAILNYTTQVNANKSVGEIYAILSKAKVQEIATDFEDGQPSGIRFKLIYLEQPIYFRLPCNVDGVLKSLCRAKGVPNRLRNREQARRVAWRIIKDWVEAQSAIVEAQQAEMTEVFLPYVINENNQTLFQAFTESKQKLLSA
jgi:hypothetical protein